MPALRALRIYLLMQVMGTWRAAAMAALLSMVLKRHLTGFVEAIDDSAVRWSMAADC